jgi:DNA-binding response OmpR family regulator
LILIVDDDAALLRFTEKYLVRLGYRVSAHRTMEEAWAVFSGNPAAYAIAILDVTAPATPADEMGRRLLEQGEDLRLLFWSGYPFDVGRVAAKRPERVRFLLKPFTPGMLAGAIGALLETP